MFLWKSKEFSNFGLVDIIPLWSIQMLYFYKIFQKIDRVVFDIDVYTFVIE